MTRPDVEQLSEGGGDVAAVEPVDVEAVPLVLDEGGPARADPGLGPPSRAVRLETCGVEVPGRAGDAVQRRRGLRRDAVVVQDPVSAQPAGDPVAGDLLPHRHAVHDRPFRVPEDEDGRVPAGVQMSHQISLRVSAMSEKRGAAAAQVLVGQEKVAVIPRRDVRPTHDHCRNVTETVSLM